MKIKKVEIQAFRAYNLKNNGIFDFTLENERTSNFVAIYAPNGFGKSSFYDAVEWAITNSLERISGDYNRKNNELAANSTKQDGIGQKILRNTDAAEKTKTSVTVFTTWKNYTRTLKKPRSDSRDIQIKNNKKKEATYFSQVILSQDAIDRFLREAKPQDRYSQFMNYFGDASEITRQKITALINDNGILLQNLRDKHFDVASELNKPVDVEIFDKFNSLALELCNQGEKKIGVIKEFSLDTERDIVSFSLTRTNELLLRKQSIQKTQESIIEKKKSIPIIKSYAELQERDGPKLEKFKKGFSDYSLYNNLRASNEKNINEINSINEQLSTVKGIQLLIPDYLSCQIEINNLNQQKQVWVQKRTIEMSVKSDIENAIKKNTEQLSIINTSLLSLRSQFNQSNHLFEEISLNKIKLKELVAVTTETDAALSLIKAQQEITQTELNKITSLNIDSDSLIKSSSDLDGFDPERIKDLNLLARELSTLQSHEQTIRQTQNTLNQQMSLHEKLISAGLEFLSISPTNICPLCRTNHESTLSLKAIIENNDLVSGLAKENYRLIEQSLLQQKNINSKMLLIVSEALDYRSNKISTLQIKLKELAEEISNEVYKNKTAAAQIKNVTAVLDKLQNETFNIEKSEFITRINNEINLFSIELHKHESIINECRLLLSKNKATIIDIDSELNSVTNKIISLTTSESTLKVNLYLSNNGLLAKELHDNCYEKINVLNKLKNEYEEMVRSAEIQCSHIHSRMIENGTWIEFDELTRNLNELDVTIKKAQSDVYDYFYSIEKLIQVEISHDITSVESAIAKTIIDIDNEKDLIDSLIKKYELLLDHIKAFKPYIKSLELRQSLIKLEKDISQHESVEAILREELNNTLTELKNKVDSFFFTELINSIYKKIDPHPTFKEVEFRPSFDEPERPVLHIVLKDAKGEYISPILYFSAAQMNILSLSVFLANALHARDDNGTPLDVIMIDDPIQSMDSINVLSMIDLLRSISIRFNKQIIISTHDENFFELLQRKIPANALGSKFLKLEKFGVVVPVEPISE